MTKSPTYDLINEFTVVSSEDREYVSVSPHWILCTVTLDDPLTFSRSAGKSKGGIDWQNIVRASRLVIVSDCTALSITNSKDSHTKSLTAVLLESDVNYLSAILPGDWICAWMVNDEASRDRVLDKLRNKKAANSFEDGLKFVGRVDSVRKQLQVESEKGTKHVEYQLSAFGFRELDTQLFYDRFMAESSAIANSLPDILSKIGIDINETMRVNSKLEQEDNVHVLIPNLFEILLGRGASTELNNDNQQPVTYGLVQSNDSEAKASYLVPDAIGTILGKTKSSKPINALSYSDIVELVAGVQAFDSAKGTGEDKKADVGKLLNPKIQEAKGNQRYTGMPMLGAFILNPLNIVNQPVWNILNQYLNPEINELYTCLRTNASGDVVPTVVLRQKPFTTPVFAKINEQRETGKENPFALADGGFGPITDEENEKIAKTKFRVPVTEFHNIPRWNLHPALIKFVNIGRSDATRVNFVHVFGVSNEQIGAWGVSEQLALNPPIVDVTDISRNGIRPIMKLTSCLPLNTAGKVPGQWMELIADRLIGSHLTLNGHITLQGIQTPICEGDNLQWDGTVYHIESVTHECSISPITGSKSFTTNLTLVNGIKVEDDSIEFSDTQITKSFYAGLDRGSNTSQDPGRTVDQKEETEAAPEHDDGKRGDFPVPDDKKANS